MFFQEDKAGSRWELSGVDVLSGSGVGIGGIVTGIHRGTSGTPILLELAVVNLFELLSMVGCGGNAGGNVVG